LIIPSDKEIAFMQDRVRKILENFREWQEKNGIYCSVR
jgi:hypothetical protein